MGEESLVSSNVDYDLDGKQIGRLAVPQSTNSAGWANYFIPIAVIKHGEGPTALLFGGNHGDEYEGACDVAEDGPRAAARTDSWPDHHCADVESSGRRLPELDCLRWTG